MKKLLAFVLALTFLLSAANATGFEDFTDKNEIQYADAVSVLNRIGVVTGYSDESFRPAKELSRGAAAKIIVSLRLGSAAASAMSNDESPYPDVPAGHTFAGVISYCKTAGLIDGYADGTFRPGGVLTGSAFAKMLLGVLGYDSNQEGFTGEDWVANVTHIGKNAGLFNGLSFQANAPVSREIACQLAFNALKANMVDYDS